jgi:hypothetical protein
MRISAYNRFASTTHYQNVPITLSHQTPETRQKDSLVGEGLIGKLKDVSQNTGVFVQLRLPDSNASLSINPGQQPSSVLTTNWPERSAENRMGEVRLSDTFPDGRSLQLAEDALERAELMIQKYFHQNLQYAQLEQMKLDRTA